MKGRRQNTLEDIGRLTIEARKATDARREARCKTPRFSNDEEDGERWCRFQQISSPVDDDEPFGAPDYLPEERWCEPCRSRLKLIKAERKAKNTLSAAISRYIQREDRAD